MAVDAESCAELRDIKAKLERMTGGQGKKSTAQYHIGDKQGKYVPDQPEDISQSGSEQSKTVDDASQDNESCVSDKTAGASDDDKSTQDALEVDNTSGHKVQDNTSTPLIELLKTTLGVGTQALGLVMTASVLSSMRTLSKHAGTIVQAPGPLSSRRQEEQLTHLIDEYLSQAHPEIGVGGRRSDKGLQTSAQSARAESGQSTQSPVQSDAIALPHEDATSCTQRTSGSGEDIGELHDAIRAHNNPSRRAKTGFDRQRTGSGGCPSYKNGTPKLFLISSQASMGTSKTSMMSDVSLWAGPPTNDPPNFNGSGHIWYANWSSLWSAQEPHLSREWGYGSRLYG